MLMLGLVLSAAVISGFNGNFNESCCANFDVVSSMAYNRRRQPPPRGKTFGYLTLMHLIPFNFHHISTVIL